MAFTVKLTRNTNQSWGFRLQGGKDFSTPLSIQKVNPESLAEKAGLQSGDAILKINDVFTDTLRHKEAQDAIMRAGSHFELTVQRGAVKTWKPSVTPLPDLRTGPKQPLPSNDPILVTKTSLAANKQEVRPIGSSYNLKAKPFGGVGEINGDRVAALVHNQYNSPAGLYSMQNIADTLTAQAEVLSTGAMGFNFMKTDPPVNKDSAVLRMVLEEDTPGAEKPQPEPVPVPENNVQYRNYSPQQQAPVSISNNIGQSTQEVQSRSFKYLQRAMDDGEDAGSRLAGLRHVEAPKPVPPSEASDAPKSGDNVCVECGRVIIGVFVRIKDRSLHADCFKCTTCGTSLRNVGYYNIADKLYCDVHARLVAKQQAPSENIVPVTVPPGGNFPKDAQIVGLMSTTSPGGYSPISQPAYNTPSGYGAAPYQPPKPSATTPISVAVDNSYKIPYGTHQNEAHTKPLSGGSKFVWPPKQGEGATPPIPEPVIETSLSPTIPTYRAPPSTQKVQFTSSKFKQTTSSTTTHSSSGAHQLYQPQPPQQHISTPSPKASPSFSPIFPTKTGVPATPSGITPYSPSITAPKPFSPLNIGAAAPRGPPFGGPASPGISSAWVPASPIGATTKPLPSGIPQAGTASSAGSRPAPRRGRGILNTAVAPGTRIPICAVCGTPIRGPFVTALGKTWCAEHFHCVNAQCRRHLQDTGFVEEQGQLYCELCYETYLAPVCSKCNARIKGDCLNAIGKQWHPECFTCAYCRTAFGNSHFYLEDGLPYCEKDWNELFTTKCVGCGFPIEAGDRWVEALNSNYHSQCFKCTMCHKNLEGQSFYAKGGRPFCKTHAR